MTKTKKAVAAIRVSSTKQGLQGDSPDDQKIQLQRYADNNSVIIKKFFTFVESASGQIQPNQKAIDFCLNPKNKIDIFLIKSIDRFTRGGSFYYAQLKNQLSEADISLVDLYGVVNGQKVNTLAHLGIKYKWSEFNPSYKSEILEAERAKDEIRDILTRMLGAEIRYVRMGYRVRQAPFGFKNKKVDTIHGRRVILIPHPLEAKWIIKMFELRIQGNLTDEEIVKKVNKLGAKNRITKTYDKSFSPPKVVGFKGGKEITVKQLQRYIKNPIYAGINTEKWTNGQAVKCQFTGLVNIRMFNKANKGRISIIEQGNEIMVVKAKLPKWQTQKCKDNPDYPFKQYVLCPVCKNKLLGSASRGKLGKYYPAYHCHRGHYFREPIDKFDKTIDEFVKKLNFPDKFKKRFAEIVLEEWEKRQNKQAEEQTNFDKQIKGIDEEITSIKDKIKQLSSLTVIKMLEADIEKLIVKRAELKQTKENKKEDKPDIQLMLKGTKYYMEHFQDLILNREDYKQSANIFATIFDTPPDYDELKYGTPKLSCLFRLKEAFDLSERQFVSRQGLEP